MSIRAHCILQTHTTEVKPRLSARMFHQLAFAAEGLTPYSRRSVPVYR